MQRRTHWYSSLYENMFSICLRHLPKGITTRIWIFVAVLLIGGKNNNLIHEVRLGTLNCQHFFFGELQIES